MLRPLRQPAEWVNKGLIKAISVSPYVRDGKARERDWERRFEMLRGKS